jgi:hypothetical protein
VLVSDIVVPRPVILVPEWKGVTPAAELWRPHVHDELTGLPKKARKLFDILLMAGSKADFIEAKVLNLLLGAVAYTIPTPVFFGLWGTAGSLTDAFVGNTANEVSGGAYDRVSMTNNTTNFATVAANASKVNSVAITFPTATANWNAAANLNQVGTLDGNLKTAADNGMFWGDLTVPKPVLNADQAQFAASAWAWTED